MLLSPTVLVIAVATRLLLMANLDPNVAMKIATTGGLVGTLVGTIVPLLPPFLPLFVVWLVIARRYVLAGMAALSTALVSPAKVSADEGWHSMYHQGRVFFSDQLTHPGLWVVAVLSLFAALATTPKALLWVRQEELFKEVDKEVEEREKEVIDISIREVKFNDRIGELRPTVSKVPYEEASDQVRRKWRLKLRDALREAAKRQRRRKVEWRVVYLLAVAAATVPLVGAIAQFYEVPATGADPAFIVRRPWLPPEVLTTKSGRPEVGYVLSTADKWFTLLVEKDRTIHYIPVDDVTARAVCAVEPASTSSSAPLLRLRGVRRASSKLCPSN